jgi:hypothetical protein
MLAVLITSTKAHRIGAATTAELAPHVVLLWIKTAASVVATLVAIQALPTAVLTFLMDHLAASTPWA